MVFAIKITLSKHTVQATLYLLNIIVGNVYKMKTVRSGKFAKNTAGKLKQKEIVNITSTFHIFF